MLIVSDIHGDPIFLERFKRSVKTFQPDVIAMEMLPLGPFNPQTAHSVTHYFGQQYYDVAEELSKHYTVIGLEKPSHRPYPETTRGFFKNMILRASGRLEKDWIDTLSHYKNKRILLYCGKMHAEKLQKPQFKLYSSSFDLKLE